MPASSAVFAKRRDPPKHLAVYGGPAKETLSQQMIAKIDTPEAREIYGVRLAIVEPVFGHIRAQKR